MACRGLTEVAALCIAIDLGGTQVRAALLNGTRIIRRRTEATAQGGPDSTLAQFDRLIAQVREGTDLNMICGIAVASAGPLDTEAGIVLGIPTIPKLDNFPIVSALSHRTERPVFLENDAIAAAYGEWVCGAGRGMQHIAYVTVSTGIGGGIIVDGNPVRGRKGMAGHIGHIRLMQGGPKCSCGATGCFEALASGTAFAARARANLKEAVDPEQVFDRARAGDAKCLELVEEEARYLGQGITSVIHFCSPERVVIGGGLSHGFDLLEAGIHAVIRADALQPFKEVPVVQATLGDNAGLIGAAALMTYRIVP